MLFNKTTLHIFCLCLSCCLIFAGTYIIVITSRKEVGEFIGFPVYKVMSMKFLSCNEALRQSTSQEVSFSFWLGLAS